MQRDHFGAALGEVETWICIVVGIGLLLFVSVFAALVYFLLLYVAGKMNDEK